MLINAFVYFIKSLIIHSFIYLEGEYTQLTFSWLLDLQETLSHEMRFH